MQAEINGLMMAKKNSAVLWTVDQHTNDSDVKAGRKTAQKNIGITKDTAHNPPTGKLIDYAVEHNFIKKVTLDSDNDLTAEFGQPTLSDITPVASENKNWSLGTNKDDGTVEVQNLTLDPNTDVTTDGNGTTYVSSVAQASNGKVTYKTKTITAAAVGTSGIVPLIADITDVNGAIITNKEDHAVTPLGVKDAIDTLNVDDSAVSHKYVSAVNETHGKISVSREFLTLDSINPEELHTGKTVGINATTGAIEPQDLGTVDITEGSSPTNRFVSSIDQASNGQVSYTTQQLKAAASNSIGGIKIGYQTSDVNRNYAVQLDNEQAYVNVPWENTHYASKNVICKTADGKTDTAVSTSESAYLNHVENDIVTDSHKISGSGITVAYNNTNKTLTLTSNSGTVTSVAAGNGLQTADGNAITSSGTISVKADGDSITVGSSGIKVTDPIPPHPTTKSGKFLGVQNDGTTDWLTIPQEEVFYAEYGSAHYQDVTNALTAGKLVYTKYTWGYNGDYYLPLTNAVGTTYYFETFTNTSSDVKRLRVTLTNADAWSQDEVITDGLPVHTSADASKVLVMNSYNTAEWRNGFVPIYNDYTDSTSVVGWKIATTKVPTTQNNDSSSVSAWVTIRSRGATSNPRNQGTLFAGYLWINYRGNGTSTPTISTVFNSLTNYTRGWKLYRNQYTESDRYVSDWYVCLPDTVQWIEITMHVLGTVGSITLSTDRVSSIGSGWTEAIEASKTPFMLGSGGVGGPNQPVYVNDDGKIVASSQIHAIYIGGTGDVPSEITAAQYQEIQTAVNNNEDVAVYYSVARTTYQYYYNATTMAGYLFYKVGLNDISVLEVSHSATGQGRHVVTVTTHQYDSSTQAEYLYSQGMIQGGHYSTIEAGTISTQGGAAATVLLTESTDTNLTNPVTRLKAGSRQIVLNDYTDNTQNHITSSMLSVSNTSNNTALTLGPTQLQITSGGTTPVTINTTGFATSNGAYSVVILNNGSGITVTDGNGTSTFTGGDGANHWGGYSIAVGTLPSQGSNVIAFL